MPYKKTSPVKINPLIAKNVSLRGLKWSNKNVWGLWLLTPFSATLLDAFSYCATVSRSFNLYGFKNDLEQRERYYEKGHEHSARHWCQKLCTFLIEVTCALGKYVWKIMVLIGWVWISVTHSDLPIILQDPEIMDFFL